MKKLFCLFISVIVLFTFCSCKNNDNDLEQQIAEYRANKTATYIAENDAYNDYEVDVAFLGDCLTDGYDVKFYYPNYLVSNRGIGGDTTLDLENRLKVSLYDLKPKVATILIGANNMDSMFDNYEEILKGVKANASKTKIILLSLTSMSGEWGRKNQLASYNNVKIKLLAEKYGFEYVDLYSK